MVRFTSFSLLLFVFSAFAQKPATLPTGVVVQGEFYISQADGAEMVYIPPGDCTIGLAPGSFPGGDGTVIETGLKPGSASDLTATQVRVVGKESFRAVPAAATVSVKGFFIDRFEVSNRRYKKFMDATKHPAPVPLTVYASGYYTAFSWPNNTWFTSPDPIYDGADHPVTCVSWAGAMAYAKWAAKMLPTEIQWERAARGTNNWTFPWGDQWNPDNANTIERGDRATRGCGTTTNDRSTFAVMDMAGNVSEWTIDEWSDTVALPVAPVAPVASTNGISTNAAAPAPAPAPAPAAAPVPAPVNTNALHVIKGGNWGYIGFVQPRAWARRSNADEPAIEPGPVPHSVTIGFRCVIPAP